MKSDSLLFFETPMQLFEFVDSLNIYDGWKIKEGLMNDRGKAIEGKEYTKLLRNLFEDKGFFRKQVSLAEVVSWLDNIVLIARMLRKLSEKVSVFKFSKISISVEYMIKLSKKMRVDYIFIYDDSLLLLELRTVSKFEKVKGTWDRKIKELLVYKELMSNYIQSRIIVYAMIPLFEYSGTKRIEKHIINNEKQLNHLIEYIETYLL